MLVEYIVFAALVLAGLVAAMLGVRGRREDAVADPSAMLPFGGGDSFGSHGGIHSHNDGVSRGGGMLDGSGGAHSGGSHDGGDHSHGARFVRWRLPG